MAYHQNIFYTDSHPNDISQRPVILFFHGFFMNSTMFDKQVSELSGICRIITCDFRGFGKTVWDGNAFTLYDIIDDLTSLVEYLGIKKYTFAGMSMGGYVALRMALKQSSRLNGLILISTQSGKDNSDAIEMFKGMRDRWENVNYRSEVINGLLSMIVGEEKSERDKWGGIWRSYKKENIYHAMNSLLERDDIESLVPKITLPSLIIHGRDDMGVPFSAGESLQQRLPNASPIVAISTHIHAVNISHHQEVNLAINKFVMGL